MFRRQVQGVELRKVINIQKKVIGFFSLVQGICQSFDFYLKTIFSPSVCATARGAIKWGSKILTVHLQSHEVKCTKNVSHPQRCTRFLYLFWNNSRCNVSL